MKGFFLVLAGSIFLLAALIGAILAIFADKYRKKDFWRVVFFWFVEVVFVAISFACFYSAK